MKNRESACHQCVLGRMIPEEYWYVLTVGVSNITLIASGDDLCGGDFSLARSMCSLSILYFYIHFNERW